jgi:AraC-like DNA-binding protein
VLNEPKIESQTLESKTDEARGHPSQLPNASGAIARLAFTRAKAAGIAVEPLLKGAHLTLSQMENPHLHLKVRDQIQFLNLVAGALADDFLGFHLAQAPDLREFGLFYYVLASAETLMDAFERAARYSSILNEGICCRCTDGGELRVSLCYVGVNRHPDRHQIEFLLTALIRISRQLTGMHLMPTRMRLIHFRERGSPEFPEYFGDDVQFGADEDEIVFPARIANLPVVSADPYLSKILIGYCEEALSKRMSTYRSFRANVENAIVPLLPHGKASASEIARRLGIGQRTFARRLSTEGLTFSGLLERLRFDLANRYLQDRNLSISEIAWLLGYQEVGGFSHAFKRWTGKTPRERRTKVAA